MPLKAAAASEIWKLHRKVIWHKLYMLLCLVGLWHWMCLWAQNALRWISTFIREQFVEQKQWIHLSTGRKLILLPDYFEKGLTVEVERKIANKPKFQLMHVICCFDLWWQRSFGFAELNETVSRHSWYILSLLLWQLCLFKGKCLGARLLYFTVLSHFPETNKKLQPCSVLLPLQCVHRVCGSV